MIFHENEHTIITVHTWTAIFLEHLTNTSFMASFQTYTEFLSGLSLWACILLPCLTQYLAFYLSGSGFTPNAFLLSGWLLTNTNVQVNIITTLQDICAHMHIHHIGITILLSFLHICLALCLDCCMEILVSSIPLVYNGNRFLRFLY